MKKILGTQNQAASKFYNNVSLQIYRDLDTKEYVVVIIRNGKKDGENAWYYTGDLEDARDTMLCMVNDDFAFED